MTTPPLTEQDYADVRAAVMGRLRRRTRLAWLPYAAAAGLLIAFLAARRPEPPAQRLEAPAPFIVQTPPTLSPTPSPVVVAEVEAKAPRPPSRAARQREPVSPPLVIHLQTADPDVRIIWIVGDTLTTETQPLKEES